MQIRFNYANLLWDNNMILPQTVTGRFGPIPVRTSGRFGLIPFR